MECIRRPDHPGARRDKAIAPAAGAANRETVILYSLYRNQNRGERLGATPRIWRLRRIRMGATPPDLAGSANAARPPPDAKPGILKPGAARPPPIATP